MSNYTKQNLKGKTLKAEYLEHIEDGIVQLNEEIGDHEMRIASLEPQEDVVYNATVVELDTPVRKYVGVAGTASGAVTLVCSGKNLVSDYAEFPVTDVIKWWHNEDGTITSSGTATGTGYCYLFPTLASINKRGRYFPAGDYVIHTNLPAGTMVLDVMKYNSDGGTTYLISGVSAAKNNVKFTLSEPAVLNIRGYIDAGKSINATFYVQVERGDTATKYESATRRVIEATYPVRLQSNIGTNVIYDESGSILTVTVYGSNNSGSVEVDDTLTKVGLPADSAATGMAFERVRSNIARQTGRPPQDYGAVGDGVADDTQAIQDCIDSNTAVFFPPGTYKITSPLTIKNGLTLYGNNRLNTLIKAVGCDLAHFAEGASSGRISGLGFIGDESAHKGFVFARNVQHWIFEDIIIRKFGDTFFDMVDKGYVGVIWIRNSEFTFGGSSCIDVACGGASQVNSVDVQNCEIANFPHANAINLSGVRHCIMGNTIQNTVNGINIQASLGAEGAMLRNTFAVTILSNHFEGISGSFVRVVPQYYVRETGEKEYGFVCDVTVAGNYGLLPDTSAEPAVKFEVEGSNCYDNTRLLAHGNGMVRRFIYYGNHFMKNVESAFAFVDGGNVLHSDSIIVVDSIGGDRTIAIKNEAEQLHPRCINMGNATVISMAGVKTKVVKIRGAYTEGTATVARDSVTLQAGASLLVDVENDGVYEVKIPVEMTADEGTEASTITINGQLATGEVVKTFEADLTTGDVVIGATALITDIATDTDHASKEFIGYEITITAGSNTLVVGNPIVKCVW